MACRNNNKKNKRGKNNKNGNQQESSSVGVDRIPDEPPSVGTTNPVAEAAVSSNPSHIMTESIFFSTKSKFCILGEKLTDERHFSAAEPIFKQGSESGCILSMDWYSAYLLYNPSYKNNYTTHLVLPWALEGSVRGHTDCMARLVTNCYYNETVPCIKNVLEDYWMKFLMKWGSTNNMSWIDRRNTINNEHKDECAVCLKKVSEFLTLKTCDGCKCVPYCSKECQEKHWLIGHKGECQQLIILYKHHKPYAEEIRNEIVQGGDPKNIQTLQKLRKKLGLTHPREEYQEYLTPTTNNMYNHLLLPSNNGTVRVGSTPETI